MSGPQDRTLSQCFFRKFVAIDDEKPFADLLLLHIPKQNQFPFLAIVALITCGGEVRQVVSRKV